MQLNKVAENISAMSAPSVGIAGEVRCVVTKADGTVKTDTSYQKNLILNQGLDFLGGGKGSDINTYCAIGSGNSAPAITQTNLDAYITQSEGIGTTSDYSYVDKGDNLYRMWEQKMYRFTGLADVNISEVGLVSTGTTSTNYYLTTRALIKDSVGAPTSISVKTGETLDIYYKIHKVIDTRDKAFVINVLDGNGGSVPYNVIVRPANVGKSIHNVSKPIGFISDIGANLNDIVSKENYPASSYMTNKTSLLSYLSGSYKGTLKINLALGDANTGIRNVNTWNSIFFLPFQMRFGRVSDDAPIPKTANDTLTIPLEFSWGRYEGEL